MPLLARIPFLLLLVGLASASMLVPAAYALAIEAHHDARSFFYSGVLGITTTGLIALALSNRPPVKTPIGQLIGLTLGLVLVPLVLAVPFYEAVQNTSFMSAYFEMLSALTTTGMSLFEATRLSGPEHFWRAQVGWMGGLLMWVAAGAILAPLTVGGFEVTARNQTEKLGVGQPQHQVNVPPDARLMRSFSALFPIFVGLTGGLALMLLIAGDPLLVAMTHAMSIMATSGITPLDGLEAAPSGRWGEMILFCFMFFALSRLTFSADTGRTAGTAPGLSNDPEFRLGVAIILIVPVLLFLRHWIGALDVGEESRLLMGLQGFWGGLFTSLSFLSTTGFVSADWSAAQTWSGLPTPGILLMALALIGGGVATTAGGVKLLRVFALYLNGAREIERLVHPSSVGRTRTRAKRIRKEGAFIAWVSFMLFAVTLSILTVALSYFGLTFEESITITIAALSNTGPLLTWALDAPIDVMGLEAGAKLVILLGMILGRLELLAIIVMLSPELWRD